VWQKARDMGYGNVTEALIALERMKSDTATISAALDEAVEYLDGNRFNRIEHGSNLHRTMKGARVLLGKESV
jgi:hypothetical protein